MHTSKSFPLLTLTLVAAATLLHASMQPSSRIRVLLDSDANNEMDDQYAIAYLLLNGNTFDVDNITVNRTRGGGGIEEHAAEAERIVTLSGLRGGCRCCAAPAGRSTRSRTTSARRSSTVPPP